jgi:copper chaperone CopZ
VALEKVDGVDAATVSYEAGIATVTFDPERTSHDDFIAELERLTGFTAVVVPAADSTRDADTHLAGPGHDPSK